ncbi:MAG: GntR family transcriptional regulator [Solirubrobacterales bacterium]
MLQDRVAGGKSRITRAERVRVILIEEILAGRLEPGTHINEMELAARLGVSRTPVREAFRQLAACGLVVTRPHCGVEVTPPSRRLIEDLFEAYAEILELCLRKVERMTPVERRALRAAEGGSAIGLLAAGSANRVLGDQLRAVWQRVRPFLRDDSIALGAVHLAASGDQAGACALVRIACARARDEAISGELRGSGPSRAAASSRPRSSTGRRTG